MQVPAKSRRRAEQEIELVAAYEQRDLANAALEAALDALDGLVRYVVREGGYMAHRDQVLLGNARALLVAAGRSVER